MPSIVAGALALIGLLIATLMIPGLKGVGVLLAVAAGIVGAAAAINAPRTGKTGAWAGWAAVALAVVTLIYFAIWYFG